MLGEQDAAVAALEATEAHWSEEAAGLKADCDEIKNAQRTTVMALEDAEKSCARLANEVGGERARGVVRVVRVFEGV